MICRKSGTLHVCASAVVLLSVVALSAMSRSVFKHDSLTDWLTVLVSFGGLLVSGAAFVYLKGTFEATRAQADAAKESLDQQSKLSASENRPWLVVESLGEVIWDETLERCTIALKVQNRGKSPAFDLLFDYKYLPEDGLQPEFGDIQFQLEHSIPWIKSTRSPNVFFSDLPNQISIDIADEREPGKTNFILVMLGYSHVHLGKVISFKTGITLYVSRGHELRIREGLQCFL